MIVILRENTAKKNINYLVEKIEENGYKAQLLENKNKTLINLTGNNKNRAEIKSKIEGFNCVKKVLKTTETHKLVNKKVNKKKTVIDLNKVKIGGDHLTIIAGPCAVENEKQIMDTAKAVKKSGAKILRGGAYKPRTSPYSFQGLGKKGLELLAKARQKTGLKIITELMDLKHLDLVYQYTDIIQIGARNMQNYPLLKEVGKLKKPVMIKRGISATIKEWLLAAEYVKSEGNKDIILCERGIRTFTEETRYTMDISAIPLIKEKSKLPIIADPSHGTGRWELVEPMAKAAVAAGADGIMIEVHPQPEKALSDGRQSLKPEKFDKLIKNLSILYKKVK